MGCAQSDQQYAVENVDVRTIDTDVKRTLSRNAEQKRCFHEDYVLQQKLGKGAFAVVYLAHEADAEPNTTEQVAVKITDLRHASKRGQFDSQSVEAETKRTKATEKEISLVKDAAGSDNVIRVFDFYVESGLSYVIFEKCDRTLLQVLERSSTLDEDTLKPIIKGMLSGIAHVHTKNIVHRDVKPDNFLCFGRQRVVKLCDFGLAAPSRKHGLYGVCGTPPFMSPEMLRDMPYDGRSDVWAMGVILYAFLLGEFPYMPAELTSFAMKSAIARGRPGPSFAPSKKLRAAGGARPSTTAAAFLRDTLSRMPEQRLTAKAALDSDFLAEHWVAQGREPSLKPAISSAKALGVFGLPSTQAKAARARFARLEERLAELQQASARAPASVVPTRRSGGVSKPIARLVALDLDDVASVASTSAGDSSHHSPVGSVAAAASPTTSPST
mmetsp:Transcript_88176/g.254458  ORF Transcript_88176/g.254458 Transcript_88176/m.254458 type:complete len:441 (-) Transcript_88176:16-1338(-)